MGAYSDVSRGSDHQLTFTTSQVNLIRWSFKWPWPVFRIGVSKGGSLLPVESQLFGTDRPSQVLQVIEELLHWNLRRKFLSQHTHILQSSADR